MIGVGAGLVGMAMIGGSLGGVVSSNLSPFLSAVAADWDGAQLPLADGVAMVANDPANKPVLVGNALRFTAGQYLKMQFSDSVNGKTFVITAKPTSTPTQFAAILGMVGAAGGYLDLVSKTVGKFEGRLRHSAMGFNLHPTPYNALGNFDALGTVATYVVRFQGNRVTITVNGESAAVATLDGSARNISEMRLGFGGQGYGIGMDFYRIDVLDGVGNSDIMAITAQHALFGPGQIYETPFLARKFITVGDSIDSGIASTNNNFGFAQQARAAVKTAGYWTNNDEPAIASAQMSPFEQPGAPHMNAAQIAGCFSNVVNTASIWTDAVGVLIGYGVNDFARDVPIGTASDVTDQTFFGAMNLGLKRVSEMGLLVVGRTPFYFQGEDVANLEGHTLQDYRDAMVFNFNRWGVPYADLFNGLGINSANVMTFTTDGAHPNQAGHDLGAVPMIETIKGGGAVPVVPAGIPFV